jgi:hypothetical protein
MAIRRIPPKVIERLSPDTLATLAALAGQGTTVGPSTTNPVTPSEINFRKTLCANSQSAWHEFFVAGHMYGKSRDAHFHPTDYFLQARLEDGKIHVPVSAKTLRQQIKRMDKIGVKTCVLMGIPLKQKNASKVVPEVGPDDGESRADATGKGKGRAVHSLPIPRLELSPAALKDAMRKGSLDIELPDPELPDPVGDRRPSHSHLSVQTGSLDIELPDPVGDRRPSHSHLSVQTGSPPHSSGNRSIQPSEISCCGNYTVGDQLDYYLDPYKLAKGEYPAQPYELFYASSIDYSIGLSYQKLSPSEKKRFYPMITGMNPSDDQAWVHMYECLRKLPNTFVGGGEFTVHKEIVAGQVAGIPATLDDVGLHDILRFAGQVGIFITIHCDNDELPENATKKAKTTVTQEDLDLIAQGEAERNARLPEPKYIKPITAVFKRHKETAIVYAHGLGLGRFLAPRDNHVKTLEAFLSDPDLEHVFVDLSWDELAAHINKNPDTQQAWANLINTYPGRFLFGTDGLVPKDAAAYGKTRRDLQTLVSLLNPGVYEMVFHKNFKALVERSKMNRDSWERAGCPILQPHHYGLYRPKPEGRARERAWKTLRQKAGTLKDDAAKRILNRGKKPTMREDGTTSFKIKEWKEHQLMSLEDILDELRDVFVDKHGEEALAAKRDILKTPLPVSGAADSATSLYSLSDGGGPSGQSQLSPVATSPKRQDKGPAGVTNPAAPQESPKQQQAGLESLADLRIADLRTQLAELMERL